MHIALDSLSALWKVALIGVLLGAGLPALYSIGMRGLGMGRALTPDGQDYVGSATVAGRLLAYLCFAVAIAAVLFGITTIVFGTQIFGGH